MAGNCRIVTMRRRLFYLLLLFGATLLQWTERAGAVALPYATDFTSDTLWTAYSDQGSAWELGTPAYGITTGAHSPAEAWDVALNSAVTDGTVCYLYSPAFDFNQDLNCRLSFWQNRSCEDYFDGFRIDYSLDGSTWLVLGLSGDANGKNWFTRNNIEASGLPAWSGDSHGWQKSEYRLSLLNNYIGSVRFRFVFTSNDSVPSAGCSIDDFSIEQASAYDVELRDLLRPDRYVVAGVADSIQAIVRNVGASSINNVLIDFTTDGVMLFSENINITLGPSEEDTITLQWHYTPPAGDFYLSCFLSNPSDGDRSNDTLNCSLRGLARMQLPFADEFMASPDDWATDPGSTWTLVPDSSGASSFHWDDSPGGDYLTHTDASLYSPFIQWNGERNVRCSFLQQCETESGYDGFRLEYTLDGGLNWLPVGQPGDENTENWYDHAALSAFQAGPGWSGLLPEWRNSRCLLSALDGWVGLVQFRFHLSTDGSNVASGVRIDDFRLEPAPGIDLSINDVSVSHRFAAAAFPDSIHIRIRNTGSTDLQDPVVQLELGTLVRSFQYSGVLQPGAAADWTIDTIGLPEGPSALTIHSAVPSDGDNLNDSRSLQLFGIPTRTLPFTDDLESAILFADTSENWSLGKPAFSSETSAASGMNAWNLPGSGSYPDRVTAVLYTPYFNLRGWYNPRLKFNHWFNTQSGADGGRVEVSVDSGMTWSTLGQRNDPLGINWYNTAALASSGQPGWSGGSGAWGESVYWMPAYSNAQTLVQFRFIFQSDDSVAVDGWSIDDIRLEASPAHSVSPEAMNGLPDPINPVLPAALQCRVRNSGALPVSEFDLRVLIDDSLFQQQHCTLPTPIGNGQVATIPLSSLWQAPPGGHEVRVIATATSPAEAWPADDTLKVFSGILDTSLTSAGSTNWCDDFDGTQAAWLSLDPLTRAWQYQWQYGSPDKPGWSGAFNGINAWVTGLHDAYEAQTECALYTPVFLADSGRCYRFSFQHMLETEQFQDGGTVEYSLDRGWTWQTLGAAGDPGWFNAGYITGLGLPPVAGFTGSVAQWTPASHDLVLDEPSEIVFRFRFGSDASIQMNGWAIDQVCFSPVATCTIGLDEPNFDDIVSGPYPNPATTSASLVFRQGFGRCSVQLTDVRGQVLSLPHAQESPDRIDLPLNGLSPGIYIISVDVDGRRLYRRLIVQ